MDQQIYAHWDRPRVPEEYRTSSTHLPTEFPLKVRCDSLAKSQEWADQLHLKSKCSIDSIPKSQIGHIGEEAHLQVNKFSLEAMAF
ncbi:hypothetical protein LguiA_005219 [Lonicera macranthoides]